MHNKNGPHLRHHRKSVFPTKLTLTCQRTFTTTIMRSTIRRSPTPHRRTRACHQRNTNISSNRITTCKGFRSGMDLAVGVEAIIIKILLLVIFILILAGRVRHGTRSVDRYRRRSFNPFLGVLVNYPSNIFKPIITSVCRIHRTAAVSWLPLARSEPIVTSRLLLLHPDPCTYCKTYTTFSNNYNYNSNRSMSLKSIWLLLVIWLNH